MKIKKTKLGLALAAVAFIAAGCGCSIQTNTSAGSDLGGIFVSGNKGDVWKQISVTPSVTGAPGSISYVDTNELIVDPSDSTAVYLASVDNGLFYTYNVTNGWNFVSTLPKATINDLAVDPKSKCTLYAGANNKLYKSTDCGRTWMETYTDPDSSADVMAVAIDHYDSAQIYLGTSKGAILKSLDSGQSWSAIQHLDDGIVKIVVSPQDSRIVFVASSKSGLYRFNSGAAKSLDQLSGYKNQFDGTNWINLNESLKDFNMGFNFKGLVPVPADNSLFLATDKVLLKSTDNGQSWAKVKLITADADTAINAFAVNPKDSKEIYYVTNTTFFRSIDGGETWVTKQLPTTRGGSSLLVDFNNPQIIYMGVKKIKK